MIIIWIILYGIIYSLSEKLSRLFGDNQIITVLAIILYIVVLYLFLEKRKKSSVYGLCAPKYWSRKDIGWLMPLLAFLFANLYFQGTGQTIIWNSWIMLILMLFEVFLEELLFRGYLPTYLLEKYGTKKWTRMVGSSILFGMLHIVNLFQGANFLYTIIQMLCAFGLGLCLCVLVSKYKSIFPGTIIHYLINITSLNIDKSNDTALLCFFILSILYIPYACLLDRKWSSIQ